MNVTEVVLGHQLDGLQAQDSHIIELAAVEQHLGETQVVGRGGDKSATAGEIPRPLRKVARFARFLGRDHGIFLVRRVDGGQAFYIFRWHEETGVLHAEGFENAFFKELVERLPGHNLYKTAKDIGGEAVLPDGAWPVFEWNRGELGDRVLNGLVFCQDLFFEVHLIDQGGAPETVGQTRGVTEQVTDRDLAIRGNGLQNPLLRRLVNLFHADLETLEFWEIPRNRIVEQEVAFLEEHHDRNTGDRLGHGIDPKDRTFRHWHAGLDVLHPVGLELNHLPVAGHHGHRTGEVVCLEVPFDEIIDAREAIGRHTDILWGGRREALTPDDGATEDDDDDEGRDRGVFHGSSRQVCRRAKVRVYASGAEWK